MGKAIIFIVVYSLFLIGLFFIFLYLLSTVNPRNVSQNGTEVLDEDELFGPTTITSEETGEIIIGEAGNVGIITNTITTVMKTAVVLKPTYITQSSTESTSRIYREIEPRNDIKRLLSDPHFEGFRKSGSDVELQPSGNQSIIFKILDNDGSSRVEIKINNKKKRKKTRNLRDNSRQRFPRNDTNVRELSNLTKDTVLILLPNNTLVYEVKEPDTLIKIEAESDVTMIKEYLRENPLLLTKGLEVPNSSKLVEEITISDSLYVTLETRTENATTLVEDVTEVIEPTMAAKDPVILAEALPAEDPVMSAEDNMMPIEDATLQAERTQTLVKDIKTLNKLDLERANEILLDNSLGKAELERYLGSIPTLTSKTTHDSYQMSHEE